jgi:hypothetical protein
VVSFGSAPLFINNTVASNIAENYFASGQSDDRDGGAGIFTSGFHQNGGFINNIVAGNVGGSAIKCIGTYVGPVPIFQMNVIYTEQGTAFAGSCPKSNWL